MPKLIDYPRTTYAGAWELSEVVDDTGGKCALDTAARKLNRKVSGSFKAIIGSAVKFGLLTSKRDLLSTTTLFRRIKHAYDKAEELVFHREAFLTPPLFTQVCRKFRGRELPVQMLDVMLIREFGVEEINALGVAKAFAEGARAVGLLDERNILADIDQLAARQPPRRELGSPTPAPNAFRATVAPITDDNGPDKGPGNSGAGNGGLGFPGAGMPEQPLFQPMETNRARANLPTAGTATPRDRTGDAVEALFATSRAPGTSQPDKPRPVQPASGMPRVPGASPTATDAHGTEPAPTTGMGRPGLPKTANDGTAANERSPAGAAPAATAGNPTGQSPRASAQTQANGTSDTSPPSYQVQLSGPGLDTALTIADEADLDLAQALLEKIRRQLRRA